MNCSLAQIHSVNLAKTTTPPQKKGWKGLDVIVLYKHKLGSNYDRCESCEYVV
eukprot:m.26005 g.26005  ORF g.26005 m.26005 type:complete len:53 (-) comp5817_c0_seq3:156-314(-)